MTRWIICTFSSYLLYEILWYGIFGNDFFCEGFERLLFLDLLYCSAFSLVSISLSSFLSKLFFFRRHYRHPEIIFIITVIIANLGIAYLFININKLLYTAPVNEIEEMNYIAYLVITAISLLLSSYYCFHLLLEENHKRTAIEKALIKSQLSPHFIFNSLNSLAELIHQDASQAEEYVISLSQIFRQALSSLDDGLIPISKSLQFIHEYVNIMRKSTSGTIDLQIAPDTDKTDGMLFSLSLQILVENAIKHNTPDEGSTLTIHIWRDGNTVVVSNNILNPSHSTSGTGIGLESLRKRYAMEGLAEPVFTITNGHFESRMAIINDKTS